MLLKPEHHRPTRSGMTLIELLVVASILVILAGILIPRLRVINKDRNIRESARVVASAFASASQRGINDGLAGIEIVRNTNIAAGGVNYAGVVLFQLRKVSNYGGDTAGATATITGNTVTIPAPWEQAELQLIRPNDQISFNYSSLRYRITTVSADGATLTIQTPAYLPAPPDGAVPFVVFRQPRRVESSREVLPEGYIIDFRVSGPINGATGLPFTFQANTNSVAFFFNKRGGVDSMDHNWDWNPAGPPAGGTRVDINDDVRLLVREYETTEPTEFQALANPANLWVTVDRSLGASNVANIAPVTVSSGALATDIVNSQTIANTENSAAQ